MKLSKTEVRRRTARLMAWEDYQRAFWFLLGAGVMLVLLLGVIK